MHEQGQQGRLAASLGALQNERTVLVRLCRGECGFMLAKDEQKGSAVYVCSGEGEWFCSFRQQRNLALDNTLLELY